MEKEAVINKEVADLIVSLCFSINEMKRMSENAPGPNALLFQWVHRDVKHRMDTLLGAVGIKSMAKEVGKTKNFVRNALTLYKMAPNELEEKTKVMLLLDNILTEMTKLEHLLTFHLNGNP